MIELSKEQKDALQGCLSLLNNQQVVTLGGYAGTGKTTLIRAFLEHFSQPRVAAFVGKAADVLRKKKIDASTIHKMIYKLRIDPRTNKPAKDMNGNLIWDKKPNLTADIIIIDESSMLTRQLKTDLESYGKPIILTGDHGQLGPVNDDFNPMENPDFRLETIHRNAGEIVHFAHHLRQGLPPRDFKAEKAVVFDVDPLFTSFDQLICGFNKTRHYWNDRIRNIIGFNGPVRINDKIMTLTNNEQFGVFNGMQGIVTDIEKKHLTFHSGDTPYRIPVSFSSPENRKNARWQVAFAFAYAATCHKCQGDEFDIIHVVEEQCNYWEPARWNYTAASRAKKKIYWS